MPNIAPTDANLLCLMCESAREETFGKASLLGFIGGDEILFPRGQRFPLQMTFAFVYVLKDGSGQFRPTFELFDSSMRSVIPKQPLSPIDKQVGRFATILVNIPALVLPSFGTFSAALTIDSQIYRRALHVNPI